MRTICSPVSTLRVVDGDTARITLDLGHFIHADATIRLQGIDCPEQSTEAGKKVTEVCKRWLQPIFDRKQLWWESTSLDKYRRSIGDFYDKEHPGQTLVKFLMENGLCVKYSGEKRDHWSDLTLRTIEEHAGDLLATWEQ